jgi:hypothetical protein
MIPADRRDPFTDPSVMMERHVGSLESENAALRAEVAALKGRCNELSGDREMVTKKCRELEAVVAAFKAGKEKDSNMAFEDGMKRADFLWLNRKPEHTDGEVSWMVQQEAMKSKGAANG